MRIEEVVGERVRAKRDDLGWSQAELGERVGKHLGGTWSRQSVSAAEKGKRAFPVAELVAFAHVLDVTISYLLLPPPDIDKVEISPGVVAETGVIMEVTLPFKGTDTGEARFQDASRGFLQHLGDLGELTTTVRGDIEAIAQALRVVQTSRDPEQVTG